MEAIAVEVLVCGLLVCGLLVCEVLVCGLLRCGLLRCGLLNESLPFTLRVANPQTNAVVNSALYAVSGAPPEGSPITGPTRLRFEYSTAGNELHVVKEFNLDPSGYIVTFNASVPEPYAILWGPAVGDLGEASRYVQQARGLLSQGNKVQRLSAKDLGNKPSYEGDFQFVGVDDHYFMTAAIAPGTVKVTYHPISIPPPPDSKDPDVNWSPTRSRQAAGRAIKFFVGPKDFDVWPRRSDLVRAIDFGIFAVLVVPLLRALKWVNGYVGNYGWAIIILTIASTPRCFRSATRASCRCGRCRRSSQRRRRFRIATPS